MKKSLLLIMALAMSAVCHAQESDSSVDIQFADHYKKNKTDFTDANKIIVGDITVYGAQNDNNDPPRFYDGYIRWYKKTSTIVESSGLPIVKVEITNHESYAFPETYTLSSGDITIDNSTQATWTDEAGTQKLNITNTKATSRISGLKIYLKASAGISDIEADSSAPVEYFNLQGMPVNPEMLKTGGIYIRRQGGKAVKIRL
ncbi:MAG: hypothetical protein K2L49_08930 [Muribaculaceae bacterium]|nr:hypothetical protein [Muribaculaceae bacterium]